MEINLEEYLLKPVEESNFLSEGMGASGEVLSENTKLLQDLSTVARNAANSGVGVFFLSPQGKDQGVTGYSLFNLGKVPLPGGSGCLQDVATRLYSEDSPRNAMAKMLMSISACYLEVPTQRYKDSRSQGSFDKFLVTANVDVAERWYGSADYSEKLAIRFEKNQSDFWGEPEAGYCKLDISRGDERKIVQPRKPLDLSPSGIRMVPIEILNEYLEVVLAHARDGYVKVTYLKDSGQVREVVTTLNEDLLREIYSHEHVMKVLEKSEKEGEFVPRRRLRGYATLPEVGLPETDEGTRAVNFSRILKVEYNVEPDLTYLKVDLPGVPNAFFQGVEVLDLFALREVVDTLIGEGYVESSEWYKEDGNLKTPVNFESVTAWFDLLNNTIGTQFQKDIHRFMSEHPVWFPKYTGEIVSPESFKMEGIDLDNLGVEDLLNL